MTTRSLDATVATPFRSTSDAEPLWLVDIPTGLTSPTTLRYTTSPESVTFGSQTYSPLPQAPPTQSFGGPGEPGEVSLTLGDADVYLCGLIEAGAVFEGRTAVMHLTDRTATGGSGSYSVADEYVIEKVDRGEGFVTLHMRNSFGTFDKKCPPLATRAIFPGLGFSPLV